MRASLLIMRLSHIDIVEALPQSLLYNLCSVNKSLYQLRVPAYHYHYNYTITIYHYHYHSCRSFMIHAHTSCISYMYMYMYRRLDSRYIDTDTCTCSDHNAECTMYNCTSTMYNVPSPSPVACYLLLLLLRDLDCAVMSD